MIFNRKTSLQLPSAFTSIYYVVALSESSRKSNERLSVSGETPRKPSFAVLKSIPCLPVNLLLMAGQVTPDDNAPLPGSLPQMSISLLKHSGTTRLIFLINVLNSTAESKAIEWRVFNLQKSISHFLTSNLEYWFFFFLFFFFGTKQSLAQQFTNVNC